MNPPLGDGRIVVAGGKTQKLTLMAEVIELDTQAGVWRQLPPLPRAMQSPLAAPFGDAIVVTTGGGGGAIHADTYVLGVPTPAAPLGAGTLEPGRLAAGGPPVAARAPRVARDGRAKGGRVTLSIRQLLINQRISQAALRRLARVATLRGTPASVPTSASGDPADVTLSVGQMRINQRIAQAAVLRANALAGGLPGAAASGDGPGITLSAGQLAINQRISVAAVRRANALLRTEGASSAPA